MKDIADDLNLSVVTVSKVLRNQGRISAATRERVLRRARELNYQPNLTARALVTGRSQLVGLVVPDLLHPFFAAIAKSIVGRIRSSGYCLVVASSEEDPNSERELIESLLARGVDALVLASSQASPDGGIFERIEAQNVPYVLVDRMVPGLNAHFIGVNNEHIGRLATEHLIERGYQRIAHIRGPGLSIADGRFQGYRRALARYGRPVREQYVVIAQSTDERGEDCGCAAMQQLLAVKPRPDAVFCYNDLLASGALKAIFDSGLKVPHDVAVIGASNLASLHFWNTTRFRLSTVDQSVSEMGEEAARLILRLMKNGETAMRRKRILPAKLILGDST